MALHLRVNDTDDPAGRYIGWAPVPIRMWLEPSTEANVPVRVRSSGLPGGGHVVFRNPVTSVWAREIDVEVPGSGRPLSFEVAGHFGYPSSADLDAEVDAEATSSAELRAHLPLMVRVRKDCECLSAPERECLLSALATINDAGAGPFTEFRGVHDLPGQDEMHGYPAFLPWHRAFLLDFERELQRIHPAVALPYWRFDRPAPKTFSPDFLGAVDPSGRAVFAADNPLLGWVSDGIPGVTRPSGFFDPATKGVPSQDEEAILRLGPTFDEFRAIERTVHVPVHLEFRAFLGVLHMAARDPLFFPLHAAFDRLWARWQQKNQFEDPDVAGAYESGQLRIGHGLNDTMWPWNQVTVKPRPGSAPGGTMPPSPVVPAPGPTPRVRDMFDYRGQHHSASRLGFDYDDVPFAGVQP